MFESVLIANRGEIACRIIRTAKKTGLRTIAVYSDADRHARHVAMADEAVHIGPAAPRESYLDISRIIAAATASKATAIHPGYGFLSEKAAFAEACAEAGIVFVGPPADAIRAMGLKDGAKALMEQAGVPVVPGYHGERQDAAFLQGEADEIGYPVLIKAVAGGGGKGMRRVDAAAEFASALESAQREAASAFGDPRVLIEKYVLSPRHIEIQVFCDAHGNGMHLFERDCSLQRRHQKVIEEAPAPGMSEAMRAAMGAAAVAAAKAVGYVGAGTVEFIADGSDGLAQDRFYFMEMNTRLQVEHPVTEAITGLDLVELQLQVAAGAVLPLGQDQLHINGHAVEARLYAEDPERGFLPSTGRILHLAFPPASEGEVALHGLRIDAGVRTGDEVSAFYDPMIAKVIAHGATRDEALARLEQALLGCEVLGPRTNAAFLARLAGHPEFGAGQFDTGFIDRNLVELGAVEKAAEPAMAAAGALRLVEAMASAADIAARRRGAGPLTPFDVCDGFEIARPRSVHYEVICDGTSFVVELAGAGQAAEALVDGVRMAPSPELRAVVVGAGAYVLHRGRQSLVTFSDPQDKLDAAAHGGDGLVRSPMHGRVTALFCSVGDVVAKGDKLLVVEAMKMEHALLAPMAGKISELGVDVGAQVPEGARLAVIHPAGAY